MATLMQKDVLLELVSTIRGKIFYNLVGISAEELEKDRKYLSKQRELYYSTLPAVLDYKQELKKLQSLKQKYEG